MSFSKHSIASLAMEDRGMCHRGERKSLMCLTTGNVCTW